MVGGEEHDDFESGTRGVDLVGDPQEIRRHGGGRIRCRG